jgi:hypothetical protein
MPAIALNYTYRYPFPSAFDPKRQAPQLRLATCGGADEHPFFFKGGLTQPRQTAELLCGLVRVVQSRFHLPTAALLPLLDPVVTSGGERLRFEGFSGCCSTYVRVDLLPEAFTGEFVGRGTTNVDFNQPMQSALARIRPDQAVAFTVGADGFELSRGHEAVVERKVTLPVRWLKGFVEVQAYQARMLPFLEVSGVEAQRFFRALPRTPTKSACWVVPAGKGLRISHRKAKDGVCVGGLQRLCVLEHLARNARTLRIYAEPATQTSAWELAGDVARFHLVLSPDVWRGFSGEGQVLGDLAGKAWERALPRIQTSLQWEAKIDAESLARRHNLDPRTVDAALSMLASRGLVGYDLAESAYFHRELPFDLSLVDTLQPRLRDARELVEGKGVRIIRRQGEQVEALVPGSGFDHRVSLSGEEARCTCPWFAKHRGLRGPCKHVLAAQIVLEELETVRPDETGELTES